jgi:hypothetical protein
MEGKALDVSCVPYFSNKDNNVFKDKENYRVLQARRKNKSLNGEVRCVKENSNM